jgi:pilus assembly protein Flp/PilA
MATSLSSLVKRFARDERGATMVEYSVLIGLVTIAIVTVITALSTSIQGAFQAAVDMLNTRTAL